MAKHYRGNIPPPDSGWDQLAAIKSDGAEWLAYRKQQEHDPAWVNYKLVANGRIQGKANYWIVRNVKTGQIAFARDALLLRNNRPQLNSAFESVISGNSAFESVISGNSAFESVITDSVN